MATHIFFGDNYHGLQIGQNFGRVNFHLAPERVETPPSPDAINVPALNAAFVDRQTLFRKLSDRAALSEARVALIGLGGSGKTQLAVKFVKEQRRQNPNLWVLWIHARNAVRFEESISDVSNQLRLHGRQTPKANLLQLLQYWLADTRGGSKKWIVVLDNVDDASFLLDPPSNAGRLQSTKRRIDYFPFAEGSRLLITSRTRHEAGKLVDEIDMVEVPKMSADDANQLLRKGLQELYDETTGPCLAKALEFIPFALSQAVSYLRRRKSQYSVVRYIEKLEEDRDSRTGLLRREGSVPQRDRDASTSILLTWQISFTYIQETRPSAAKLLALMSFCDHQAIPERLLNVSDLSQESSDEFEDDIAALEDFMFVSYVHPGTQSWQMHRLVQDSTHWWLRNCDQYKSAEITYLDRITQIFPHTGAYENWEACQLLLPHVENVFSLTIADLPQFQLGQATLYYRTASYAWQQGMTNVALERADAATKIRRSRLGEEHTDTLECMTMLAFATSAVGRWAEAEEIFREVAETSTRVQGAEDPSTLSRKANLASAYSARGRYEQAAELSKEVMEAQKRLLGAEHHSTLITTSNLAFEYRNLGRWDEAEQLELCLVEISQRELGTDHPDTLQRMENLATTYWCQGKYVAAEELEEHMVKTLEEHKLGVNHPLRPRMMSNLATTYRDRGKLDKAEKLDEEVKRSLVGRLGFDHPDTLSSMLSLASSYHSQGKLEAARKLQTKVLETWQKRQLDPNHPTALGGMTSLAHTYRDLNRWEEAEKLELSVLETRKKMLGNQHLDTLRTKLNLAATYWGQGEKELSEKLRMEVLEISKKNLDTDHPFTLSSMADIAQMYYDQEKFGEAEKRQVEILKLRKEKLGFNHPDTLQTMHNLAFTLKRQGREAEAVRLLKECIALRQKILGKGHPATQRSSTALARWKAESMNSAVWTDNCNRPEAKQHDSDRVSAAFHGSHEREPLAFQIIARTADRLGQLDLTDGSPRLDHDEGID